jgi:sec-independent protein translocase protein TatA
MGLDNPIHIAFLLILLLLVFGAKRLPEMGRSLGEGMRGFKDSISGENSQAAAQPVTQPATQTAAQPAPPVLVAQQQQPVAFTADVHSVPEPAGEQIPAA